MVTSILMFFHHMFHCSIFLAALFQNHGHGKVIGIILAFSLPAAAALDIRKWTQMATRRRCRVVAVGWGTVPIEL